MTTQKQNKTPYTMTTCPFTVYTAVVIPPRERAYLNTAAVLQLHKGAKTFRITSEDTHNNRASMTSIQFLENFFMV